MTVETPVSKNAIYSNTLYSGDLNNKHKNRETYEQWTSRSQVFRSSIIQMLGSYYLPGKKMMDKLSAIHITI